MVGLAVETIQDTLSAMMAWNSGVSGYIPHFQENFTCSLEIHLEYITCTIKCILYMYLDNLERSWTPIFCLLSGNISELPGKFIFFLAQVCIFSNIFQQTVKKQGETNLNITAFNNQYQYLLCNINHSCQQSDQFLSPLYGGTVFGRALPQEMI